MRIPEWCESPIVCAGQDGSSVTVGIKPLKFVQSYKWQVESELAKRQSMRMLASELQRMAEYILEGLED